MPIPKTWLGPFYSPDEPIDDLMFDLEPGEFLNVARLHDPNPAFLAAAAYVDCHLNRYLEKAEAYLALGKELAPDPALWNPLIAYLSVVERKIAEQPQNVAAWCNDLYGTVVELFGDFVPLQSGGRVTALGPLLSD